MTDATRVDRSTPAGLFAALGASRRARRPRLTQMAASSKWWSRSAAFGVCIALLAAGCAGQSEGLGSDGEQLRAVEASPAELQLLHSPPMAFQRGSAEVVELIFDVVCVGTTDCEPDVVVHHRHGREEEFAQLRATRLDPGRFAAIVPLAPDAERIQYFATADLADDGGSALLPPDGGITPYDLLVVDEWVRAQVSPLGPATSDGVTVASGGWGDDLGEFGSEGGGLDSDRIGPSAFDVDAQGHVFVLDQFNQRVQQFVNGVPAGSTPVDIGLVGGTPDLAVAPTGASLHVLEWGDVRKPESVPAMEHYLLNGTLLDSVPIAADWVDGIDVNAAGLVQVHGYPSDLWMPTLEPGGTSLQAVALEEQLRRATEGRMNALQREVVLRASDRGVMVLELHGGRLERAWLVEHNDANSHLGEVHVAEVRDDELLLGLRVWSDEASVFRLMRVSSGGTVLEASVTADEWADAAPVSRIRTGPDGNFFVLHSRPDGISISQHNVTANAMEVEQ